MKFSKIFFSAILSTVLASDVTDLSKSTDEFNDFISSHGIVLAKFFAPWCGHCKKLAPEYEVAATKLKNKDISLVEIDCTQNQELCAEHKIQGYPSLVVFRGLESSSQYSGGRSSDEIIQYMERELLPTISVVTEKNFDEFAEGKTLSVLAVFDSSDAETNKTITDLANTHHHQYAFGASSDKEVAKKLGITKLPAIAIFSEHEDETIVLNEENEGFDLAEEYIITNLLRHSIAPAGEISPNTFRAYMTSGLPLAYFFYSSPEERDEFTAALKPLARELREFLNIGFIDAAQFGAHAPNLNLNDQDFPAFSIHEIKENRKFPIKQTNKLDIELITQHVRDYVAGKLVPDVKSEPIPETQEGPVYKAVLGNYEDLVLDDEKDVLIEFYAPWCGHCKNLAPTYDELGGLFFNDAELTKKVSVAKMDHTANELDSVTIQGYPTIMLFPAGKKDAPIVYDGARTLEALNAFIRDKGTHEIDGLANKKKNDTSAKSNKKSKKVKRSKKSKKAAKKPSKDEL